MNITNINYASPEVKSCYNMVTNHFYKNILLIQSNEHIDSSDWLSDYAGCGLTDAMLTEIADEYDLIDKHAMLYSQTKNLYFQLRYKYWVKYIQHQIYLNYNINITSVKIALEDIFNQILQCNTSQELTPICNKPFSDFDYCQKMHDQKYQNLSKPEINHLLQFTTNSKLYAQYSGVTIKEADKILSQRENTLKTYKAYRPHA